MDNIINISTAKNCKFEVLNFTIENLLKSKYFESNKYFSDRRKWTAEQKTKFIESLLLGFAAPQLFIYENKQKERFIIDGYIRLQTIKEFFNDEFSLEKMSQLNWNLNGKTYSRLNDDITYKLNNCPVIINLITRVSSEEDLKRLYINLNT